MNSAGTLRYRQNQKRQGHRGLRRQAKREINDALDSRAVDLAEDARKINEFYTRFAAESDAEGFAKAVIDYAGRSQTLVEHLTEICAIADGHRHPATPESPLHPQTANLAPVEAACRPYDLEQKRLSATNDALQHFLHQVVSTSVF